MSNLLKSLKDTKIQILVIAALTFLVYANSLPNKLLWDDHLFLEQWPQIQSFKNLPEILKGSAPPSQDKIYRPFRGVFYMIDYQLWGANPLGYRVQAVLIHLMSTILVYFIVRELVYVIRSPAPLTTSQSYLPFVTALLFGLHPIHTETIDYISTSMESFGTVFFFLSFWLYLLAQKYTSKIGLYLASIIFAVLAFFTYEMTLTLPLLLTLYELVLGNFKFSNFKFLIKILPYFTLAIIFVAIRFSVLGLISRTDYLGYSFYLTQLTMVKIFVRYIGLLLFPINQTAIHNLVGDFPSSMIPYDKLDPILNQTIFDADVLLSVAAVSILILVAIKYLKKYRVASFSILWFFISLLPVSYIIPHGGAMAEKYLYIPSFGFLLLMSHLSGVIFSSSPGWVTKKFFQQLLVFCFVVLIVVYSGLTIVRNTVWRDDISLFSDVVKKSPENLLANYTLGIWYGNFNRFGEAEKHYRVVLDKAPDFWQAGVNLGNLYLRGAAFDKAAQEYQKVLNLNPNLKVASNTLKNMSLIKASSDSAQIIGNEVFVKYKTPGEVEFFFPAHWFLGELRKAVSEKEVKTGKTTPVTDEAVGISLQSPEGLKIQIIEDGLGKKDIEQYINDQKETHGKLINQGLAQIPNFEKAYVKVWEGEGVTKLQFFLFQDKKVVQLIVYPASLPQMKLFDILLGSIRIHAT